MMCKQMMCEAHGCRNSSTVTWRLYNIGRASCFIRPLYSSGNQNQRVWVSVMWRRLLVNIAQAVNENAPLDQPQKTSQYAT